jgi:cytochrome c oxidase cbb3-type subunit I/II
LFSADGRDATLDTAYTAQKMKVLQGLGVPYTDEEIANADRLRYAQAAALAADLNADPTIKVHPNEEIVALIAYLQRLGTDIKLAPKEELDALMK